MNYKNRLRLAKVIVKNKMSRFYGSVCILSAIRLYTVDSDIRLSESAFYTLCPKTRKV